MPKLVKQLFGKLFADKGYLSQALFEQLLETFGVQFITQLKSNMKNRLMPLADRLLLRKRAIVETILDQLKNISQIEHTRHRSPVNFLVNLLCGLIAYCHQPKKTVAPLGRPAASGGSLTRTHVITTYADLTKPSASSSKHRKRAEGTRPRATISRAHRPWLPA